MLEARLELAARDGWFDLPGRICVLGARAGADLSALGRDLQIVQRHKPDFDALTAAGYDVRLTPEGAFAAALVVLPRAKLLARHRIAQAAELAPVVFVDGQKTDGIDSLQREIRARAQVDAPLAKAHGKLLRVTGGRFDDWRQGEGRIPGGYVTSPGSFSADGIDHGSALLGDALPMLKGSVADLGAGWGYLSRRVLERDSVTVCHLVEADHDALECARRNVADSRARFHWADATRWRPADALDHVVTNPPFHAGRTADPDLGRAFLVTAARSLRPSGRLWLVANRHLPYEQALSECFARTEEIGGDAGFKVLCCSKPRTGR
ncbi:MAG: class I SAM-dependent methyltransferase [Tranquillimonas sp.]